MRQARGWVKIRFFQELAQINEKAAGRKPHTLPALIESESSPAIWLLALIRVQSAKISRWVRNPVLAKPDQECPERPASCCRGSPTFVYHRFASLAGQAELMCLFGATEGVRMLGTCGLPSHVLARPQTGQCGGRWRWESLWTSGTRFPPAVTYARGQYKLKNKRGSGSWV